MLQGTEPSSITNYAQRGQFLGAEGLSVSSLVEKNSKKLFRKSGIAPLIPSPPSAPRILDRRT